jgi:metallo-beta-lactamase family protein
MAELQFHGAARCVTGSMHLFRHGGTILCLDCGLFQGHRLEARELNEKFRIDGAKVDKVLLSHAHIDHSGRLPLLVKHGFRGSILATPATRDLCEIMLPDSGHIHEEDAEFWNNKRATNGDRIEPLYTVREAMETLPYLRPVEYGSPVEVAPGIRAVFVEAGHILGSAMILIEVDREGDPFRLLYTGDLGKFDAPILNDPTEPLPECDYLIVESTYADRKHPKQADMKQRLATVIRETAAVGGKVIIPAFSVGRTQALLYYLFQLRRAR